MIEEKWKQHPCPKMRVAYKKTWRPHDLRADFVWSRVGFRHDFQQPLAPGPLGSDGFGAPALPEGDRLTVMDVWGP